MLWSILCRPFRRWRPPAPTDPTGAATAYPNRAGAYGTGTGAGWNERTELLGGVAPLMTPGQQQRAADGDE